LVAVERDRDLVAVLEQELRSPRVKLLAANAANIDFAAVAGVERPVVAGNLPYHLSSSILFQVVQQHASIRRAVFLLQKEVGERIAASPGGRDYGLLSVLLQAFAQVELVFEVPASQFHPPPKVDSVVVLVEMQNPPPATVGNLQKFIRIVKGAFLQRRKTLYNSLKSLRNDMGEPYNAQQVLNALHQAGIEPQRRAETLSPPEFAALEKAWP
jgi:16S rRNA (adenine1518-N6/adenine1519-N6)-dimethyltransferase